MERFFRWVTIVILIVWNIGELRAQSELTPMDLMVDSLCYVHAPEGYLNSFWRLCQELPDEKSVSVVHLGDSHVQAGFFSMPVRETFGHLFGFGGMGLILPYRLLKSNQPQHVSLRSSGGSWAGHQIIKRQYLSKSPTGIYVKSRQHRPSALTLSVKDDVMIDRVVVYRSSSSKPFKVRGQILSFPPLPVIGSDVVRDTLMLLTPQHEVVLEAPPEAEWYGVSVETNSAGIILHTLGHNGAFFSTYNKEYFLPEMLHHLQPKLLVISLGTNEALVRHFIPSLIAQEMRRMVGEVRRNAPNCAIIFTSPVYSFKKRRVKRRVYRYENNLQCNEVAATIKEEAKSLRCGFVDLYHIFGGERGKDSLVKSGMLGSDRVHLSKEGYLALGEALSLSLLRDYQRFLHHQATSK